MPLTLTITNAGRAALVNAAKDGTNAVRIAAVGVSPTALAPTATTAALPGEVKRITTISGDAVAADTIHVTVRDEGATSYSVRSIALYLADGTLFGAYGQSDVLVEKSAQAMLLLALDVRFTDVAASTLTFGATNFLNPPATDATMGVVELATDAETNTGTDDRRAVTPKGLSFTMSARLASWGSDIWRASNDGAGSGMDSDLLDGQHGSYYANIPARLGYTPANRAGDTFTGNIGIANGGLLFVEAGSASGGVMRFQRNSRIRWDVGMNTAPENGGAAGSDYTINRFDDAGNVIDTPFILLRSTGELRLQGQRAWHAGNDGAGSGLDADLLDGQDSSYYGNIPARLGYTPANAAGQQFSGDISVPTLFADTIVHPKMGVAPQVIQYIHETGGFTISWNRQSAGNERFFSWFADGRIAYNGATIWHAQNDGAGSGLDADLLDGQDSSYYGNIPARLGYTPANRAGESFTGTVRAPKIVVSAAGESGLSAGNGDGASYSVFNTALDLWFGLGIRTFDGSVNGFLDARAGVWDMRGGYRVNGAWVWHAGNDGAGSGLDADLLDGQDSSYYGNIPARLGYTPVNRAGDTFTGNVALAGSGTNIFYFDTVAGGLSFHRFQRSGRARWDIGMSNSTESGGSAGSDLFINRFDDAGNYIDTPIVMYRATGELRLQGGRAWHSGNDGAGSGLDADLLDGRDSSYFTDIIGRLGFWPVRQGTGVGQLPNVVHLGWSGTRLKATIDVSDMGNIVFDNHISDVWRVSNDGAGSGLDADLLDGRQASDFVLQNDGSRFGSNQYGYWERRPNGVIAQWGTVSGPFSEGQVFITFPIQFTNPDSIHLTGIGVNASANNRFDITIQRVSRSNEGGVLMVQYTAASSSINQIDGVDWRAVGI